MSHLFFAGKFLSQRRLIGLSVGATPVLKQPATRQQVAVFIRLVSWVSCLIRPPQARTVT